MTAVTAVCCGCSVSRNAERTLRECPESRIEIAAPRSQGERITDGTARPTFSPVGLILLAGPLLLLAVGAGPPRLTACCEVTGSSY